MGVLSLNRRLAGSLIAALVALLPATAASAEQQAPEGAPITVTSRLPGVAPDVLGTTTLPLGPTKYAIEWGRASQDNTMLPALRQFVEPARGMDRLQQIAYVQAAVAQRIRWRSDATEWGRHDYWASARETLARGAGDAEDRAILKMQALRTLGVPARDLFLTIGKESIGGPPVTVLLVRTGGRYLVLDDWSGPPIPVERRKDFVPMLSFAQTGTWIHGKRVTPRVGAVATAAASTARR